MRQDGFVAPNTSVEQAIAKIWMEALGVESVGIHDNFFDLGGNSLLLNLVFRKLQGITDRDISMISLFQYPTIGSLSNYLSNEGPERSSFKKIYDRAKRQEKAIQRQKQSRMRQRKFNG